MPLNIQCAVAAGGKTDFPCDANAGHIISLAVGTSGLALLFVGYLMTVVRIGRSVILSLDCECWKVGSLFVDTVRVVSLNHHSSTKPPAAMT